MPDGAKQHYTAPDVTRRHSNCTKTVLDGITRRQMALDGARTALYGAWTAIHGAKTALDGAWCHCWEPLLVPLRWCRCAGTGALVLVRWCDGVGAAAKWKASPRLRFPIPLSPPLEHKNADFVLEKPENEGSEVSVSAITY